MSEEQYQADLKAMAIEWGGLFVDEENPGYLRANLDPMTGMLVGRRARLVAEIINRAIEDIS